MCNIVAASNGMAIKCIFGVNDVMQHAARDVYGSRGQLMLDIRSADNKPGHKSAADPKSVDESSTGLPDTAALALMRV